MPLRVVVIDRVIVVEALATILSPPELPQLLQLPLRKPPPATTTTIINCTTAAAASSNSPLRVAPLLAIFLNLQPESYITAPTRKAPSQHSRVVTILN